MGSQLLAHSSFYLLVAYLLEIKNGIWILCVCFLFGTLAPLQESSLGCIVCELLNHDQSLPMQISSEALPFQKDNFFDYCLGFGVLFYLCCD